MGVSVTKQFKPAGPIFANLRRKARDELRALAPEIREYAQALCPRDTGLLASTNEVIVSQQGVSLRVTAGNPTAESGGRPAPYVEWVHDGTDRMPARPWITWTLNDYESYIQSKIVAAMRSLD